ncbi:hypothetical protein T07_6810 [Trichinella nelsoni]|uniref:Uncharacterized protein n=1 Tax=Trichinella nelsoni TaxID=6336 RepID=A0A0V0RP67_9BILA|nr:hypothetical protein T07_6810 [Trichinella nelsoni]
MKYYNNLVKPFPKLTTRFSKNIILCHNWNCNLHDLRNCRTSSSVCLFSLARIGQLTADMRITKLSRARSNMNDFLYPQ